MKIYTRKGDAGRTMVIGGSADKDHARIEAYGTIDELNSSIGMVISHMLQDDEYADMRTVLMQIQHELFDCGTDLARLDHGTAPFVIEASNVDQLEQWIDEYDQENPEITFFILPGGCTVASLLHVSRSLCRRAERRVVTLAKQVTINEEVRRYMNRLSDLLFVLARVANTRKQIPDVAYISKVNKAGGADLS